MTILAFPYIIIQRECQQTSMQRISSFIVANPKCETYRCCLCFSISHKIVQLICPCRKFICIECLKTRGQCPICQVFLQVEPIQGLPFQFRCMSDAPRCQLILGSERELMAHCTKQCLFMPTTQKEELLGIINYQCTKGHTLQIANVHSLCTICNSGRCKSICSTCMRQESSTTEKNKNKQIYAFSREKQRYGYCIRCRPIPCTTHHCPHGHDLVQTTTRSATCDLCDISVRRFAQPVHSDRACDFDICSNCFKDLPSHHQLLPIGLPYIELIEDSD